MSTPKSPLQQAIDFFRFWFGKAAGPNARISIWIKGSSRRHFFFDSTKNAAAFAVKQDKAGSDVYFGCGLYRPGIRRGRGEAADVVAIPGLWADVDCGKEDTFPTKSDAMKWLRALSLPPTLVVDSGNGLHAYWRFDRVRKIEDTDLGTLPRDWVSHLNDSTESKLDSVGDLARVLRVPGTANRKHDDPLKVYVYSSRTRRYRPRDFQDARRRPTGGGKHPANSPNIAEVRKLLSRLHADRANDYDDWLKVGMAIHSAFPIERGFALWGEFSRRARDKYDSEECQRKWRSFQADGGVTIATIRKMVKEDATRRRSGQAGSPHASGTVEQYEPFPVDLLPPLVRKYVSEGATAMGCDPSYIALPLLAAFASAVGNACWVRLKRTWREPCILWTATIGESGTMKSPAFDFALRILRQCQGEAFEEYEAQVEAYRRLTLRYDVQLKAWKGRARKNGGDPPEEPTKPVARRYICADVTIEALADRLSLAPAGLLVARDELAGWIASFDAYKASRGGDVAQWLEMHRAGTLIVDRKSRDNPTIHIPHAAISATGCIQPEVLRSQLTQAYFENGLAARLLVAMPPTKAKKWTESDVSVFLHRKIRHSFERLLSLRGSAGDVIEEADLPLSTKARDAWIAFYNEHALEQADLTGDLAAAWSKLESYAARFALLHQLLRWASGDSKTRSRITAPSMAAAIQLTRWFGREARRVYAVLGEGEEGRERRRLLEFIHRHGGAVTVRDVARSGLFLGDSEAAETALAELVNDGHGKWQDRKPTSKGGRPTRVFQLTMPLATAKTPESPEIAEVLTKCRAVKKRKSERRLNIAAPGG